MKKAIIILLVLMMFGCALIDKSQKEPKKIEIILKDNDDLFIINDYAFFNDLEDELYVENQKMAEIPDEYFISFHNSYNGKLQYSIDTYRNYFMYGIPEDDYLPEQLTNGLFEVDTFGNVYNLGKPIDSDYQLVSYLKTDDCEYYSFISPFSFGESSFWSEEQEINMYQKKDNEVKLILETKKLSSRVSTPAYFSVFKNEVYLFYSEFIEDNYHSYIKKVVEGDLLPIWQSKYSYKEDKYVVEEYAAFDKVEINDKYLVFISKTDDKTYFNYYDGKKMKTFITGDNYGFILVGNKIVYQTAFEQATNLQSNLRIFVYDLRKNTNYETDLDNYLIDYRCAYPVNEKYTYVEVQYENKYMANRIPTIMLLEDAGDVLYLYNSNVQIESFILAKVDDANLLISIMTEDYIWGKWFYKRHYYKLTIND